MYEGGKLTTEDILDAVMPKAERDDKTMDQTDSSSTQNNSRVLPLSSQFIHKR